MLFTLFIAMIVYFATHLRWGPIPELVLNINILEKQVRNYWYCSGCPESKKTLFQMELFKELCENSANKWKEYYQWLVIPMIIITEFVGYGLLSLGYSLAILFLLDANIFGPIWVLWMRSKYKMFKRKAEELEREIRMFRMVEALKE